MPGIQLIVDVANVMGSRPDGWWRDRPGAATRLLRSLAALPGREVALPEGLVGPLVEVVAVVEGAAVAAVDPTGPDGGPVPGLRVVRVPHDGDSAVVALACRAAPGPEATAGAEEPGAVAVASADRGLRRRLPGQVVAVGPRWVLDLAASTEG